MKALITGASSGLGFEMAKILSKSGYDLVLVARRQDRLEALKNELSCNCEICCCDLSIRQNCFALYEKYKDDDIEVLINCAGFGVFGEFLNTDLQKELSMIDTNITALHVLTKLFLKDFVKKDRGYILNVASSAAFAPGPTFSSYYASKSYVLRLTEALWEEIKKSKSNVCISALCPGPFDTEFNNVADVSFSIKGLSCEYVAKYAIDNMFAKKRIIVPGLKMKLARFGSKLLPNRILAKITYKIQKKKM